MDPSRRLTLPNGAKPPSELALFLRLLRQRIDPDVRALGPFVRHPGRRGKLVTQQELAEAIEVTREWYAALESTAPPRTSASLIDRLADVLMVTAEERARLFRLAVPEFGRIRRRDDSIAALEGFSRLRSLSKRLFVATSIEDVLTSASEQIADWFDDALLVRSTRRHESGPWECQNVDDKQDRNDVAKAIRDKTDLLLTSESLVAKELPTSRLFDTLHYHTQLTDAGDVGGPDLWPLPLRRALLTAQGRHRFGVFAWRYARVRSRTGFTGGLAIAHEFGHSYTAFDIAVLGAIAEAASLALS